MQFKFFALTDPGQIRTNNEDCVAFDETAGVAVLADGMGGYNAGEVASGMAVNFVSAELCKWLQVDTSTRPIAQISDALHMCIGRANQSILNAAAANPDYAGMGTTIVVGVFRRNALILGHVGDSRCYRWRAGILLQITKDHSLLQEQVDAGLLTPAQAAVAPGKNLLTRALGVEENLESEVHQHEVLAGDIYLMCSDGLSDMVSDSDLALAFSKCALLPELGTELIHMANAAGGRDNIGVLLVQANGLDARSGLMARLFGKP